MKKMFALFLILSFLLVGCGPAIDSTQPFETEATVTTGTPTNEPIQGPTETPTVAPSENIAASMPMITVSVPVLSEEISAEDGTVIFRSTTQNMRLVMPDPDVADRIIIDFLNRIDQTASSNNEILQQAKSAYSASNSWTPYLSSVAYAPMRIDQSVLSMYGSSVRFSGGAHAEYTSRAANYNVVTGDVLTLGSIIVDSNSVDQLCTLTIEKLNAISEEKYLRDGFEKTVTQRFDGEESYDEAWYFTTTGLCFYFDPYSIAPYASGVITVEIPYTELIGIIDDAFFPPEQEETIGTIVTAPAEDTDMTQFARISEVVLEAEAPMYVIYTNDTVQNLRVVLNDAVLSGEYTVFAAQTLCEGDAVVIQAQTNMFRRLSIEYDCNDQTVTLPLIIE